MSNRPRTGTRGQFPIGEIVNQSVIFSSQTLGIRCQLCGRELATDSGFGRSSHLRAHVRRGELEKRAYNEWRVATAVALAPEYEAQETAGAGPPEPVTSSTIRPPSERAP